MHLSGPHGGRFGRPLGPRAGMAIMLTWTVAAVICGYLVLAHTDVGGISRPRTRRRSPR